MPPTPHSALCPTCFNASLVDTPRSAVACTECGSEFAQGPHPGVLGLAGAEGTFGQPIDDLITDTVIPALESAAPPVDTESLIARLAREAEIELGNPVWEGRADFPVAVIPPGGIVVDVGCGLGTQTLALARNAGHVFALDPSSRRAALTAARSRAAGMTNVTVLHGPGQLLPFRDGSLDAATLIGVLEWSGVGSPDPLAAQQALLVELRRVLKPTGVLIIGIENRFALHYFFGAREEHTELRFVSLLPRRLARPWHRRQTGRTMDVFTFSSRELTTRLRRAGFQSRFAYPLPTYIAPAFVVGSTAQTQALRFYARHTLQWTSLKRRLAGNVLLQVPFRAVRPFAPSFWVAATPRKDSAELPSLVTGQPSSSGSLKTLDFGTQTIRHRPRLGGPEERSALVEGANARRWVGQPLAKGRRLDRLHSVCEWLALQVAGGEVRHASDGEQQAVAAYAESALALLGEEIPAAGLTTLGREVKRLASLPGLPLRSRRHGDLVLSNIIVSEDGRFSLIDSPIRPSDEDLPGSDALWFTLDVVDLLGSFNGDASGQSSVLAATATVGRAECSGISEETLLPCLAATLIGRLAADEASPDRLARLSWAENGGLQALARRWTQ